MVYKYLDFFKPIFVVFILIFCFDLILDYTAINTYLNHGQILSTSALMISVLFIISLAISLPIWLISKLFSKLNTKAQTFFVASVFSSLSVLFFVVFAVVTYRFIAKPFIPSNLFLKIAMSLIAIFFFTFIYFKDKSCRYFMKKVSIINKACVFLLIISLTILISYMGSQKWGGERSPVSERKENLSKPNIILVIIDNLAAKNLSLTKHNKSVPNIYNFAKESYVFERMHSNGNRTSLSMPSMFNSQYPFSKVKDKSKYLPFLLKEYGYKTMFITSTTISLRYLGSLDVINGFDFIVPPYGGAKQYKNGYPWVNLDRFCYDRFGLLTWFSYITEYYYINRLASSSRLFKSLILTDCALPDNFASILKHLENPQNRPLFSWFHIFSVHESNKYLPPKRFRKSKNESDKFYAKYLVHSDEMLSYVDDQFGKFIKELKIRGVYDNSIIILTSDHGTRHNVPVLGEEMIHVPFIIHLPEQKEGKRLQTLSEGIDMLPTILDVMGKPIPKWVKGESLVKYFSGNNSQKLKFTTDLNLLKDENAVAVFEGDYKLIYKLDQEKVMLYNLKNDPLEKQDLSRNLPTLAAHLKRLIIDKLKVHKLVKGQRL